MILDSSMGNLIREPEPKPSERQHSRGENSEGADYLGQQWADTLFFAQFQVLL